MILRKSQEFLEHQKFQKRQLFLDVNDFLQVVFIVFMIYLMFHNPMTAGLVVFFGGMGSMFRKVVRKQRKLSDIPLKAFKKIFDRK